jgi:lysophospholipase L1-like esterase
MAADDGLVPPATNGIKYYDALLRNGTQCAMYIYPSGGHGFGFHTDYAYHNQMLNELSTWLQNLPAPKANAVRIACIGNSITDGYGIEMCSVNGYPAQLQRILGENYNVRNFGRSSRTLLNKGDYPYMNEEAWQHALAFNPNIVVVKLGTNDSKPENWQYGSEYEHDLQQMVDSLKTLPTHPEIYLATPIPAFKSTWNISDSVISNNITPIINKIAKKNKLHVIDLHSQFKDNDGKQMISDGIHPSADGAAQMARIIATHLKN